MGLFQIAPSGRSQFVLLLFLLSAVSIQIIGYVTMTELIVVGLLPVVLQRLRYNFPLNESVQLILLICYLATSFVINYSNDADWSHLIDLMGLYGMLLIMLLFCYGYLLPRPDTLLAMVVGASLGMSLPFFSPLGSPIYNDASIWNSGWAVLRLGLGSSSLTLVFVLVRNLASPIRQFIMIGYSGIVLVFGDRSTALIGCLVALVSLLRTGISFDRPPRLTLGGGLLIVGVAPVLAVTVLYGLVGLANQGMLPEEVSARTVSQFSTIQEGIIAARPDSFSAAMAVLKSPITGYGASARDLEAVNIYYDVATMNRKFNDRLRVRAKDTIPAHSLLFGAWIKGGIFGGFFWLFVMGTTLYAMVRIMLWRSEMTDVMLLVGFTLTYSIVFEPGLVRVPIAASMTCVAFALRCIQFHDSQFQPMDWVRREA